MKIQMRNYLEFIFLFRPRICGKKLIYHFVLQTYLGCSRQNIIGVDKAYTHSLCTLVAGRLVGYNISAVNTLGKQLGSINVDS